MSDPARSPEAPNTDVLVTAAIEMAQFRSTHVVLVTALAVLVTQWREMEQRLCRKADAQHGTFYASQLGAKADGYGNCADQLAALLVDPKVTP